jgi:hypothetical protein
MSNSKLTVLASAKNLPRLVFNEGEPNVRISYILALAKIFNCLGMVQVDPKLYYSIEEGAYRLLQDQAAQEQVVLHQSSSSSSSQEQSSPQSKTTTPTTSTSTPGTSSVMYPSTSPFKLRQEGEVSAQAIEGLREKDGDDSLLEDYMSPPPCTDVSTLLLQMQINNHHPLRG